MWCTDVIDLPPPDPSDTGRSHVPLREKFSVVMTIVHMTLPPPMPSHSAILGTLGEVVQLSKAKSPALKLPVCQKRRERQKGLYSALV